MSVPDDVVEAIAHLVWKQGHYQTSWSEWHNKDRWMDVARTILELVAPHLMAQAWIEGYSDSWRQERGYSLDGLQDYPPPEFLAEELAEWNRYSTGDA